MTKDEITVRKNEVTAMEREKTHDLNAGLYNSAIWNYMRQQPLFTVGQIVKKLMSSHAVSTKEARYLVFRFIVRANMMPDRSFDGYWRIQFNKSFYVLISV